MDKLQCDFFDRIHTGPYFWNYEVLIPLFITFLGAHWIDVKKVLGQNQRATPNSSAMCNHGNNGSSNENAHQGHTVLEVSKCTVFHFPILYFSV